MTPRTEWNDLLSRSHNLACAVAMMVLSAALLTMSMVGLFCTVFTTFFRVVRGVVDRMTMKIAVPEMFRAGSSDRAECAASTSPVSFLDDQRPSAISLQR